MTIKFVGPYFKIAKAIKIFDNKIDEHDLLNYAITGKIELSIFIPEFKTLIWCAYLTKEMRDWLLDTGISGHKITMGSSYIEKDIGFFNLHYDNDSNPEGAKWVRGLDTNIGNQCLFPGIASGVWRIPPISALELLRNDSVQIPVGELLQADYFDSALDLLNLQKMIKINSNHNISLIEVNINKIIITTKQMDKLSILTGNTTEPAINKKVERHASAREVILAAVATELFNEWKKNNSASEDNTSIKKLAELINDKGVLYGLGEPDDDLTESIRKVIADAIREPDKRQSIGRHYRQVKHNKGK
ncbi:hypothetical protein R3134_002632 [Salmonella enterica]|nr:hypothetical protein [Salmonella enterica]